MSENTERKTLLLYGMEWGAWFGLYLVLRFICSVLGVNSPILNIVAMAMFIGTPIVLYYILLHYHKQHNCISGFSLLWMTGIMLFFFASLICCIPEYIFYQYINPDYIADAMVQSVNLIADAGVLDNDEVLSQMRQMLEDGNVPTAWQMSMSSFWSNLFFGSLLSAVVASLVTLKKKQA